MASAEEKQIKEFDRAFAERGKVSCMSDEDLASWQAGHKQGSADYILADQEWQSRRIAKQIRAVRWAAIIGIVGAIASAVVGVFLGWYLRS